ncbi:M23 family metallopeptidase [Chengkuizengella axinellae]|uniref:M23 family metallopeptidase n=1 Tax=Chengkuizengella axinellae TaxID=3064388 RepID=A0ABT9ITS4_9BACL|nr:M23 family metallopeptidase [Chengkuizengella sp. 2205SS18-9]MDP5272733.1 M23 family metallopeptidase [Chengkuizengella sp. 2205SS18-9]
MKIKNNVKQRRNQRLHELMQKQKQNLNQNQKQNQIQNQPFDRNEIDTKNKYIQEYDPRRLEDPEFVWKHRQDPWMHLKQEESKTSYLQKYIMTTVSISFVLFMMVWLLFQLNTPWAEKGKLLITHAMNETTIDNNVVVSAYNRLFDGFPSFIPTFSNDNGLNTAEKVNSPIKNIHFPADGEIISTFDTTKSGVTIKTKKDEPIIALDTGRVVSVENTEFTGLTVVIQHENKLQSIYGYVTSTSIQENDWVEGGDQIGIVSELKNDDAGILYFALRKDEQYIDPAEVIQFD